MTPSLPSVPSSPRTRFLPSVGFMRCVTDQRRFIFCVCFYMKMAFATNAPEGPRSTLLSKRICGVGSTSLHIYFGQQGAPTHQNHTVVPCSVSIESTLQSRPPSPRRAHRDRRRVSPPLPPSASIGNLGVDAVSPKLHRPPRITIVVEIGARRLG